MFRWKLADVSLYLVSSEWRTFYILKQSFMVGVVFIIPTLPSPTPCVRYLSITKIWNEKFRTRRKYTGMEEEGLVKFWVQNAVRGWRKAGLWALHQTDYVSTLSGFYPFLHPDIAKSSCMLTSFSPAEKIWADPIVRRTETSKGKGCAPCSQPSQDAWVKEGIPKGSQWEHLGPSLLFLKRSLWC